VLLLCEQLVHNTHPASFWHVILRFWVALDCLNFLVDELGKVCSLGTLLSLDHFLIFGMGTSLVQLRGLFVCVAEGLGISLSLKGRDHGRELIYANV